MKIFRQACIKCVVDALMLAWVIDRPVQAVFRILTLLVLRISSNTGHEGFVLRIYPTARVTTIR